MQKINSSLFLWNKAETDQKQLRQNAFHVQTSQSTKN